MRASDDMKGRVCMVTGASSGIGRVTACDLAGRGAEVILVARDCGRGEAAASEARAAGGAVSLMICDFSSQKSIRELAATFLATGKKLHVLVNNAGAIHDSRQVTVDGLEATFAVNHIGYFLLTELVLDVIKKSAEKDRCARIVNVASEAHKRGTLRFDDLQSERGYTDIFAYGVSKLANIAFTAELARRLEGTGVTANSLHPGVVSTGFGDSGPWWMRFGVKLVRPFLLSAEEGAATTIYLATSPEVEGVTGKYFKKCREARPSREASDPDVARRLWEASEKLVAMPG